MIQRWSYPAITAVRSASILAVSRRGSMHLEGTWKVFHISSNMCIYSSISKSGLCRPGWVINDRRSGENRRLAVVAGDNGSLELGSKCGDLVMRNWEAFEELSIRSSFGFLRSSNDVGLDHFGACLHEPLE